MVLVVFFRQKVRAIFSTRHNVSTVSSALRRWLFGVFVLGVFGTGAELLLLGHTEDYRQLVPLGLFALSLVLLGRLALSPDARWLRWFRALMALFVASGLVGVFLHLSANAEFELEMYPSMAGLDLLWESLRGAIPALAPGTMTYLGLLGWVFTMGHPLLAGSSSTRKENP